MTFVRRPIGLKSRLWNLADCLAGAYTFYIEICWHNQN
jgi:hypothetical protein